MTDPQSTRLHPRQPQPRQRHGPRPRTDMPAGAGPPTTLPTTPTNQPDHHPERWVKNAARSITNSDTPQSRMVAVFESSPQSGLSFTED